ncbi:hypothetical protein SPHFLASMR4Y_00238 [Sphingorhabdus sp. SMR4y]|nr:hypothetical protein SPHFLASMR4Y_00238 [Sphingorhabdus sp. SMR4y]
MLDKLSLLGNFFFYSSFGIASSFFSCFSNRIGSFFSCTGCFFSCTCRFFSGIFSYSNCVVSLFCACRKSRNSKSKATGYSEHFAEVCFGRHLKYPLWMN